MIDLHTFSRRIDRPRRTVNDWLNSIDGFAKAIGAQRTPTGRWELPDNAHDLYRKYCRDSSEDREFDLRACSDL